MGIKERISQDFIASRKAKKKDEVDVLTMVRTAIRYKEIEKKGELSDQDLIAIISHEIKQRKDSVVQYEAGQRPDLVRKEKKEIELLLKYLPAQLSEKEIQARVEKVIGQVGAKKPSDMGRVMGVIMKEMKGQADGAVVQKLVRQALSKPAE